MFSSLPKPIFNTLFTFILSSANAFNLDQFKILSFVKSYLLKSLLHNVSRRKTIGLTLSLTSPGFYGSAVQVFLKTLWEKEKLLVTSNFSFSHSVFYPFRELSAIFIKFKIVVCKLFQFGGV